MASSNSSNQTIAPIDNIVESSSNPSSEDESSDENIKKLDELVPSLKKIVEVGMDDGASSFY